MRALGYKTRASQPKLYKNPSARLALLSSSLRGGMASPPSPILLPERPTSLSPVSWHLSSPMPPEPTSPLRRPLLSHNLSLPLGDSDEPSLPSPREKLPKSLAAAHTAPTRQDASPSESANTGKAIVPAQIASDTEGDVQYGSAKSWSPAPQDIETGLDTTTPHAIRTPPESRSPPRVSVTPHDYAPEDAPFIDALSPKSSSPRSDRSSGTGFLVGHGQLTPDSSLAKSLSDSARSQCSSTGSARRPAVNASNPLPSSRKAVTEPSTHHPSRTPSSRPRSRPPALSGSRTPATTRNVTGVQHEKTVPRVPSPVRQVVPRHSLFYFDDEMVVLNVEGCLFRVHRYFLERDSEFFHQLFQGLHDGVTGRTDETAIKLDNVTQREFECLLNFLYHGIYDSHQESVHELLLLLSTSTALAFPKVRAYAIGALGACDPPLDPVERIFLAEKYGIPQWLAAGYTALCARTHPLEDAEAEVLGLQTTARLARAREAVLVEMLSACRRAGEDVLEERDPVVVARIVDEVFWPDGRRDT
ncbi:hypothetical protein A0H81_03087 [Grifola frondosa]|uniref:BTB domain-containing protein n=1 Tax=Grifola frondosa TaxID=5627 RepID=A0A1C7MGJ5_GRIFR|nr:hypothetical protein A0H81_03087 [Grifola frondosa]